MTAEIKHKFELAGLGIAPFKLAGYKEILHMAAPGVPPRAGGSCDYCGACIRDAYVIRSADGKEFKVGGDCVKKTGDRGLVDLVKREANRIKTAKRHEQETARIAAGAELYKANRDVFAAIPHPNPYFADKGQTMADSIDWYLANAGNKGKLQTLAYVAKTLNK